MTKKRMVSELNRFVTMKKAAQNAYREKQAPSRNDESVEFVRGASVSISWSHADVSKDARD